MSSRRKKTVPSWQHDSNAGNNHFVQVYVSMLEHRAWMDLSPQAKATYLYCLRNTHGEAMREDAKRTGGKGDDRLFYLSQGDAVRFGLCAESNRRALPRAMEELVSHGFVDQIWSGWSTRSRNIYRMSDRWKKWATPEFSMPSKYMTAQMKSDKDMNMPSEPMTAETDIGVITWYVTGKGVLMVVDSDGHRRRAKREEAVAISEITNGAEVA